MVLGNFKPKKKFLRMVVASLENLTLDMVTGITEYLPDDLRERIAETTKSKLRDEVRRDEFSSWWSRIESIIVRKFTEQCSEDWECCSVETTSSEVEGKEKFLESVEFVRDVDRLVYTLLSMNPFPARKAKRQRCFSDDTDDDSKSIDYPSSDFDNEYWS